MSTATKKIGIGAMFSVASVWFTTHAGAGFATGNQGWQYFAVYGVPGIIFPLISMGLLAYVLKEIMLTAQILNTRSYGDVMKYMFKPYDKLYILFEIFYYCIVMAAVGGVINASAGMMQEVIPMNTLIATIIVGIVLVILVIFGADLVRRVATVLGILIIASGFSIYIIGFVSKIDVLGQVIATGYAPNGWFYPLWRGIIYCGFQCVAIPAMVACCAHLTTKKSLNGASFIGFLMNGFGVALSVCMLIAYKDGIIANQEFKLPTLYVCQQLGITVLFYFYKICLFCCLISTGVSCVFGIVVRLENSLFKNSTGVMSGLMAKRLLVSIVATVICMAISSFGLTAIVAVGYKYCGYLGLLCCVLPVIIILRKKNKESLEKGNGKAGIIEG
jgi:uncharacterized membrane protein YkvI